MALVRIRARGVLKKKILFFFSAAMAGTVGIVTMGLALPAVSQAEGPVTAPPAIPAIEEAHGPLRYAGFSVFGPDWPVEETFATEAERLIFLEEQGYRVAQQTAQLSGNLVRVPISIWNVLNRIAPLAVALLQKPIYQLDEKTLQAGWKDMQDFLDTAITAFEKNQATAEDRPLRWDVWDTFFSGIQRSNAERASTQGDNSPPIGVNIVLHVLPPALILEAPENVSWPLWEQYRRLLSLFVRLVVQRYGQDYTADGIHAQIPIAVAIEMFNEPDYVWIPDEAKIEIAIDSHAYPCDKYMSQLHLSQIPQNDLPNKGCMSEGGFYREQNLAIPQVKTALKDFRWGGKFDRYVSSFATLHEHVSFAAQDEIARGGAHMVVVSAAVTHVNLDWFRRMYLANPNTFRFVEKIAVHPYHWPQHDIHRMDFIGPRPEKDWTLATPREYTNDYFKRFDFLRELAALVTEADPARSYGLAGKKIWATEFGIPTKKLDGENASIPKEWKLFIFDRATPIPDGVGAIVWEDKWDAFFDQVSSDFLIQNAVEAFLVFTLRESAAHESNDKNHSNFSLYRADWSSRMATETINRMADFFRQFRSAGHAENAENAQHALNTTSEEKTEQSKNAEQSKKTEQIELVRLFPSWEDPNTAGTPQTANPHGPGPGFPVCTYSSPLLVTMENQEQEKFVIVVPNDGPITALHPKTGEALWSLRLPIPDGFAPFFVSTPVQVKDKLILAYQVRSTQTWQQTGHRVSIIDLNTRTVAADYPDLVLHAEKPASDGSGMIRLSPPTAHTRSLVHAPHPGKQMGYIYVSFGNPGDIQPWHGWVFEVDLDAWKAKGPDAAVSAVLLTTPEMDCGKDGSYGDSEMICGGGVWTPAGPQVYPLGDSFEMIIPVGNGQLDMQRKDYAQSLMRVGPGLEFDPVCDASLCADFDQHDPDPACLASCQNLFIPRLLPDDPPFRPASGWCDKRTFMDCLTRHDADLGGSAPLKVQVPNGPAVYVQPGKEGAVYLLDAAHMGTLYDREQIVEMCGTKQDKCLEAWAGMIITQPVLSVVDGTPVVIVATFMRDHTHPAGLVALRIVMQDMKDGRGSVPRFQPFWQAPDFSTSEAVTRFRKRPGFVAIAPFRGEDYVWVVDVDSQASGKGLLLGVRVKDGTIIAREEMLGRGQRFARPLIHDDVVYVTSCQNDRGPAHLEAYAFQPAAPALELTAAAETAETE